MLCIVCFHLLLMTKYTPLCYYGVSFMYRNNVMCHYIYLKKNIYLKFVLLHTVYQINGPIHIYILQNASMDSTL
jgi:hypothetical protein